MFGLFLVCLLIAGAFFIVANSSYVQTKLGHWIAGRLSKKLNTKVMVDKVDADFLNRFTLKGFIVYDQQDDTLAYAEKINLTIRRLGIRDNTFRFGDLELDHATFNIKKKSQQGGTNFDFIVDYFTINDAAARDSIKSNILLSAQAVRLNNCYFSFSNPFEPYKETGVDFGHLKISRINGLVEDFLLINDSLKGEFKTFNFSESGGFVLEDMKGRFKIDDSGIYTQHLELLTENTTLEGNIALKHKSWEDYQSFLTDIRWDGVLNQSKVNLKDIGYFAPDLYNIDFPLHLEGKITGSVSNLKGRNIQLNAGNRSVFRGDFDVSGLPDAENAFIDLKIKQLSSDYNDLVKITEQLTTDQDFETSLPIEIERVGSLFFEGSFTGFSNDFVAYGNLTTQAGSINMDVKVRTDTLAHNIAYDGTIRTKNLNLGKVFDLKEFGLVAANAKIKATSKEKLDKAEVIGKVESLEYNSYTYKNINIDGNVASKKFEGSLNSNDPNFNIDFIGQVDFSAHTPILDFYANIINIELTTLNFVKTEEPLSLSSELILNAAGKTINDFTGSLTANDSFLCYGDSLLILDEVKITAVGDVKNRKISMTSDIADIDVTGAFDIEGLPNSFNNLIAEVLPSLWQSKEVINDQVFEFSVNYKQQNMISGILLPELEIASQTTAYGTYNSRERSFGLFFRSPFLQYKNYYGNEINADLGKISEILKGKLYASEAGVLNMKFENFDLDAEAFNDIGTVGVGWYNRDQSTRANLNAGIFLEENKHTIIELRPGYIGSENSEWEISETAIITVDSSRIQIDSLLFANNNQRLNIHGVISEDKSEKLYLILENFNFASLDSIGITLDKDLRGILNLNGSISDFYDERIIRADLNIKDFGVSEYDLGNVKAKSRYFAESKKLSLTGSLIREQEKILDFSTYYALGEENPLSGQLMLNDFNLNVLNAFDIPQINDYSGFANGEIAISGKISAPILKGYIDFNDARFRVDYLNTYYHFSDRVRVEDGWFGIDYKPIYDEYSRKGFIVASAFHNEYRDWSFDVAVDANNFFLLNTTRDMNSMYYGTAFASGSLQIGGYEGFLEISIDAATGKGTSIKLPLDETQDVTMEHFVHFINIAEEDHEEHEVDLTGVQLRLNVDATPDAEIQLIFDEKAGDIMRGRGSGRITLEISPAGEFLMFGRYEITEGSYLFTMQNLINKQFKVRQGGTIGWYGDPYQADIDITATYALRTPLYPIMLENQERYRGREDVNVLLDLSGKLMNPNIRFEIELPEATETERSQLASVSSTTQQLNQQVFSLLILNRFMPIYQTAENQAVANMGDFGAATTSDFISSQISNWLSELSNEFDIGINYRPGDQISSQEIAVALGTQLFNERLSVRGNFGVTSASETQYNAGQTNFLGDFLVEYRLTEDGKIRLRVFNETNPYEVLSTSNSIYTQGVGLVYQEDFNTIDEFFQQVKSLFTSDKAKKVN